MAKSQYKVFYEESVIDRLSKNYGGVVSRSKTFTDMTSAVRFSRVLANTNPHLVGRPIVDVTNVDGE